MVYCKITVYPHMYIKKYDYINRCLDRLSGRRTLLRMVSVHPYGPAE